MGCYVTVLSGSDRKKDEAMKLGAKEFIATKGVKELKVSRPLDRLLVTTSAQPDWDQIIPIMAPRATIYPLSIADGNFSIPYSKSTKRCPPLHSKLLTLRSASGTERDNRARFCCLSSSDTPAYA